MKKFIKANEWFLSMARPASGPLGNAVDTGGSPQSDISGRAWKTVLKKTSILLACVAAVGQSQQVLATDRGAYDYGTHKTASSGSAWVAKNGNPIWMRGIPDNRKLSELSMPGTHGSIARYNSSAERQWGIVEGDAFAFAANQWMTLHQQLIFGIRYLDIRVRHVSNNLQGHHGMVFQGGNMRSYLNEVQGFLRAQPSEMVLMRVKEEYTPSGNTRSFFETFNEIASEYPDLFWKGGHVPTLGQARGKVVLLQDFSGGVFPGSIWFGGILKQDQWDVSSIRSLPEKIASITAFARRVNGYGGMYLTINHLSGAGTWIRPWQVASAQTFARNGSSFVPGYTGTNYDFKNQLDQGRYQRVGVVPMDFPGPSIVKKIISLN